MLIFDVLSYEQSLSFLLKTHVHEKQKSMIDEMSRTYQTSCATNETLAGKAQVALR